MRKAAAFLLTLSMILALCACGAASETPSSGSSVETEAPVSADETAEPTQAVKSTDTEGFDLDTKTVLLNSGYEMPILGIGCFQLSNEQAENSVYWALRDGYRLIDTARIYGNEEGGGRGIRKAIDEGLVTREEIFVTTKMIWASKLRFLKILGKIQDLF